MAENKKSVLLYCDIIHTVEGLTDKEAGKLFKHYLRYINDLNPVVPDKVTQLVFEPIKQALKRDLKKWEIIIEKRSLAGQASAEKRKQNQHVLTCVESVQQASTNPTVIDSVNVKDNVSVSVKEINVLWTKIQKDFFNDFNWIEKFCRDKNLSPQEINRQMKEFIKDVDLAEDVKDLKELKSHFLHSFNKGKYKKSTESSTNNHANDMLRQALKNRDAANKPQ